MSRNHPAVPTSQNSRLRPGAGRAGLPGQPPPPQSLPHPQVPAHRGPPPPCCSSGWGIPQVQLVLATLLRGQSPTPSDPGQGKLASWGSGQQVYTGEVSRGQLTKQGWNIGELQAGDNGLEIIKESFWSPRPFQLSEEKLQCVIWVIIP